MDKEELKAIIESLEAYASKNYQEDNQHLRGICDGVLIAAGVIRMGLLQNEEVAK